MINLLIQFISFIKTAYAGTGGPNDAELSVFLIISFLAFILLGIVSFKYYKQWKVENKKRKLFGNHFDEHEQEHDLEYFE